VEAGTQRVADLHLPQTVVITPFSPRETACNNDLVFERSGVAAWGHDPAAFLADLWFSLGAILAGAGVGGTPGVARLQSPARPASAEY